MVLEISKFFKNNDLLPFILMWVMRQSNKTIRSLYNVFFVYYSETSLIPDISAIAISE